MMNEQDRLWRRVSMAKYNESVPASASTWLKDLFIICYRQNEGRWFSEGLNKKSKVIQYSSGLKICLVGFVER